MRSVEAGRGAVLSLNLHGLGDLILSLPVLDALKSAGYGPVVSVVWPALEPFARCARAIDRAVALPRERENEPELGAFTRRLASEHDFSLALDFAFMPRAGVITREARAGFSIGFGLEARDYPWYGHIIPNRVGEHRLVRNLHVLEYLGIDSGPTRSFGVSLPGGSEQRLDGLLSAQGLTPDIRPVALHPGSGAARRNWQPERFARLADLIASDSGAPIVLLGGAARTYDGGDETELAARVARSMQTECINLAGKLDLPELIALFRRCRLFVGNNSGPAHLASAVAGLPCLLVWAPRNEWAWRPVGAPVELVFEEVECSDSCLLNKCDRMQYCLGRIEVQTVFERYMQRFSTRSGSLAGKESVA